MQQCTGRFTATNPSRAAVRNSRGRTGEAEYKFALCVFRNSLFRIGDFPFGEKCANLNVGFALLQEAERQARDERELTMLPGFLLPETTIREAGAGPEVDVGNSRGGLILLTLGITRIIEQESLDVSIWGSPDNVEWGAKPITTFPQKFYCGTYQIL